MGLGRRRSTGGCLRPRLLSLAAVTSGAALGLTMTASATPAADAAAASIPPARSTATARLTVVYRDLPLAGGGSATVFSDGLAEVWSRTRSQAEYRTIPPTGAGAPGTTAALPSRAELSFELARAPAQPYVTGQLELVLRPGIRATVARRLVPAAALRKPGRWKTGSPPPYTSDAALNLLLASLGADRMSAVFPASMTRGLRPAPGGLDPADAYLVHVTQATMPGALSALSASGAIAYAAPDWTVSTTATRPVPVPAATREAADALARRLGRPAASGALPPLPPNFGLASSAQSLLNRPGIDWVPAYESLQARFNQLPGTGETITDVSLGDLTSTGIASSDPCYGYLSAFGPTTIIKNGQRYLDWPSMPLIPAWTASSQAALDPTGEVCGEDPFDTEIGLDFAMMAPLPHNLQRPGEIGSGLTDLLGIAPGARYRLVVPSDTTGSVTSVDEAFLAAAQQRPRPNVITASLAFGLDSQGFPSRYLEDDPITEALIDSIVRQFHINVAISANDGLRTSTNAAVSPSGGSTATSTEPAAGTVSNLNGIALSTVPSRDYDSGAIDAGGTTLDDVFAAPPQDQADASLLAQHAFPEVRWDGFGSFSSGFGSRVNVSAPADNVLGFEHTAGGAANAVTVDNIGGTSASAQEIGAAAAVAQQAARLAGDPAVARSPLAVRAELVRTATPVPGVTQADRALAVGPQLDLGRAVARLLASGGGLGAGVARVAVEQRQPQPGFLGQVFSTVTDPGSISLAGPDQNAWLTISPDWVGLPAGASYRLHALRQTGGQRLLATGPWARLQPAAILAAAGLSPSPSQPEAVSLAYTASSGGRVLATATIPLSFSAVSGTPEALAPIVPPVVKGTMIPVRYNLAGQTGFTAPRLVVSAPGRMNPEDDHFFRPVYTVALHRTTGIVDVPVSALAGGGIYGIAVQAAPDAFSFTDFAYTRVQAAATDARPAAPVLSAPGSRGSYVLTVPYRGSFTAGWNVRNVPGATGAYLEISAPGPGDFNSYASFNNPNGTIRDDNGYDSGSVYFQPLPGTSGHVTLRAAAAGLVPSLYSNVRVLAVTAAGTAAGEASDVSSISMDGVTPADGGSPVGGFGVDTSGPEGFLTSSQSTASGSTISSVETFSQTTQAITGTVLSSSGNTTYSTPDFGGPGMFAGEAGLVEAGTPATNSYDILHPVGTVAGPWKPPTANPSIQPADNQQTSTAAFATWKSGPKGDQRAGVFSSDVLAGTSGPVYSIEPALRGFRFAFITAVGQDTTTGTALVGASDFVNQSAPPTFVAVDLATGAVRTFAGAGAGDPQGVAVDSVTGTAVSPENSGVGIYDLASGAGTLASPGGIIYQHPAVDASRHQFLVQELLPPDANLVTPGLGAVPNDDALSAEVVLTEQGRVLQRIEQFNFFNVFTSIAGQLTQVEPAARRGYTTGLLGGELQPFGY